MTNLFNICTKTNLTELVKIEYLKNNQYLQESLNFLLELKLLEINGNSITPNREAISNFDKELFLKLSDNPEYGQFLKEYLANFILLNEKYFFKPDSIYNNLTSDLRNFLISAKKINYQNNVYSVVDLEILNLINEKEFSPEQLEKVLKNKKKIGEKAEKYIFKKESEKIKSIDSNLKVDHVALRDVSAGFDIQSYEKKKEKINKIYIEVKAVSKSNYKFYLSMQEKQTAIKFKDKYYIYLLPVDLSNPEKFNFEKLLKINNINNSIFKNKVDWKVENDGFVIFKN